jgi:hypothetical protein
MVERRNMHGIMDRYYIGQRGYIKILKEAD